MCIFAAAEMCFNMRLQSNEHLCRKDVWEGFETMQRREENDKTIQPIMMHAQGFIQGYLCLSAQPGKYKKTVHPNKLLWDINSLLVISIHTYLYIKLKV
jgi:hypothetical protein